MVSTNDDVLIQRVAEGDQFAFTELFDRYHHRLYSLAWHLTRSPDLAEDILQEVFLKIWLHRTELRAVENFHGYLVVVTRRVILNELRTVRRSIAREHIFKENAGVEIDGGIEEKIQEKEYDRILQQGLQQLPHQQVMVFRLIKQQGYSRERAASELNLSPETVKKHLERAMRTLRAFLLAHLDHPLLWVLITLNL